MDVPNELAEILIRLTEDGLIAALKQVSDLLVLSVVELAVGGQHSLHDVTNGIALHLDEQMEVVRHQAIGVEVERKF